MSTILDDLSLEEMNLILDLVAETPTVTEEREVEIHQTVVCLLCRKQTENIFMAKEAVTVSKVGEIKITKLVSDNGDKPAYTTFESTTHRPTCPVCTPRLRRLSKEQLAALCIKLSSQMMYEAQRRGVIDVSDTSEIKRIDKEE